MLFFGENPQKYFGHAKVRIVRLKDDITIIGDRWIEGNLFKQFAETEETIKNFINFRYEVKGFEREDIWDYPLKRAGLPDLKITANHSEKENSLKKAGKGEQGPFIQLHINCTNDKDCILNGKQACLK